MLVTYYLFILFLLIPTCDGDTVNMGEVVLEYYNDCLRQYVSKYFTVIEVFTYKKDGTYVEYNVNLIEKTVKEKKQSELTDSEAHNLLMNPNNLSPAGDSIIMEDHVDFINREKKTVVHHEFDKKEIITTPFRGSDAYTYTFRPDNNRLYAYNDQECFKTKFFKKKDPYLMRDKKPCEKRTKIKKGRVDYELFFLTYLTRECSKALWGSRKKYPVTYVQFKRRLKTDSGPGNKTWRNTMIGLVGAGFFAVAMIGVGCSMVSAKRKGKKKKEKLKKDKSKMKEKSIEAKPKKKKTVKVEKKPTATASSKDSDKQMEPSSMPLSNANNDDDPNVTIQDLLNDDEMRANLFALNEVENVEAEIPNKPMTAPPQPLSGMYTQFKEVGVTIPAGTCKAMFGQYDFEMGATPSTLFYEYESCGMNRIEAMAAVMVEAEKKGKHGCIPKLRGTKIVKEGINIRLLLGTSIEGDCKSAALEFDDKIDIFFQTLLCLEDLQIAHIVHRDIKPAAFRYHLDGPKIYLTLLGLARVKQYENRERVPFFGNMTFCCPNAHLKKERTFADDLISWFYMVCWTIDKRLLGWIGVVDKRVIYQNKVDMFNPIFFKSLVDRTVFKPNENKFLKELQSAVAPQTKEIYVEYPKVFAVIKRYKTESTKPTKPSSGSAATIGA
ncbi:unnamed protein product [Bursaphelenchus okinawaensis]|uniref:Protein kinase domain-containing protein n=1 Tax=Bursaphelenchus okinawaensis TaxID=465554 RepID=A0A811KE45_9BILA|nr:unnamed protein product [Bursaphelenchus okinawaensis]CAG9101910.1 unnamed protein product [Bursaphelenchus okinawaensis]